MISAEDIADTCGHLEMVVAESHPCNAAAALRVAIKFINDLVNERDQLLQRNKELFNQIVLDSLSLGKQPKAAPAVPEMPQIPLPPFTPSSTALADALKSKLMDELTMPRVTRDSLLGEPIIWWESADEHPYDKVTSVRDADGDTWKPEEEGKPEGRWYMLDKDGTVDTTNSVSSFEGLVDIYCPVIDNSPHAQTGAWFVRDPHDQGFEPPPHVMWVISGDGEGEFTRVFRNKWRRKDQTDAEVKADGYWSFDDILQEHVSVFRRPKGAKFSPLKFMKGESEPDQSIDKIITPGGFYWQRRDDGWVCPGVNGERFQQSMFPGSTTVEWDDLLNQYEHVTEYWHD